MSIKKNYEFFKCFNNMEFELIYVVPMKNDMDEEIIRHFRLDKEIMQNLQIFVNPLVPNFLQLMVVEKISDILVKTNLENFTEIKIVTCKLGLQIFTYINNLFVACFVWNTDYSNAISQIKININNINICIFGIYMRHVIQFFKIYEYK